MSKTIWKLNSSGDSPRSKFIVVYENKMYYYCKQSGTLELKMFSKDVIENNPKYYRITDGTDSDEDVKEDFVITDLGFLINSKEKLLEARKHTRDYYESQVSHYKNLADEAKQGIKDLEDLIPELRKKLDNLITEKAEKEKENQ